MNKVELIKTIATLVAALSAFVLAAETPGNGDKKKEKVIEAIQEFMNDQLKEKLPILIYNALSNKKFLGLLLELKLWGIKAAGFLK